MPPASPPATRTIAAEVDRRGTAAAAAQGPPPPAEQRVARSKLWFERLLPPADAGGLTSEAFSLMLLSQLRRNDKLMRAANNDPDSLIFAATDCAARNLEPGEQYWFVPFDDKKGGTGLHVVGMPGWKGEVQQIYRSGMVESVHVEVVYAGDHWRWRPLEMQVPEFEPAAEDMDPSNLRYAVAFARFKGGGVSQVVVMNRYQIERAKAKARTKDFWDSEWEPEMWKKTVLHRLYDHVPHSAGWNTQVARAFMVAAEQYPALAMDMPDTAAAIGLDPGPAPIQGRPVPPAMPGNGGVPAVTAHAGPAAGTGQTPPPAEDVPVTKQTAGRIGYLLGAIGWKGEDYRERRRVVTGVLAAPKGQPPLDLAGAGDLTETQGQQVVALLGRIRDDASANDRDPAASLQQLYDAVLEERAKAQAAAGR